MRFITHVIVLVCLMFTMWCAINMVLDAAIREQEFRDNIRFSRCERMDDIERNSMKGYCK